MQKIRWSLSVKLALVGAPFLLLVLLSTVAMLWMSWKLDGGAAAVNEAGRMRMQAYRMALSADQRADADIPAQIDAFDRSMTVLQQGDPARPLFVPWDEDVRARFAVVGDRWQTFRARLEGETAGRDLRRETADFVASIDPFVVAIESHLARQTSLLHLLQLSALGLALVVTLILVLTGYVFVLKPVGKLVFAVRGIQEGDFATRVEHRSSDEFGMLIAGFNGMAENLYSLYRHLEQKVAEKTSELEEKRERLEGLYEVTSLVANTTALTPLAQGFVEIVARIARADGVALRWSDRDNLRFVMLAAHGLPPALLDAEQCLEKGACHCSSVAATPGLTVIPLRDESTPNSAPNTLACARAGFRTVVNVPVRLHERTMGVVDLFYCAQTKPAPALRSQLEAFGNHLASAMENLRLNALEKEAAISQERLHLARELHDSIAQSLAFLKIQVQLLRDALAGGDAAQTQTALDEIDAGVRESYSDVRELLTYFRLRANAEDIEAALASTLSKFEHQSGIKSVLSIRSHGLPLPPDLQIQVLHIVQEALSNVRKHAQASRVALDVDQHPVWRLEVRDDGIGFAADAPQHDEAHVGLRIMKERAQRIGADLRVEAAPGRGCRVVLTLPPQGQPGTMPAFERGPA
ncbi:type IV pili methyl-accepting chemotaxis transducer N-terminal domain-containing protein [Propionivibrio dicarboxylicus]|uniref:Sensor protein n=1 Tax=Propionivibrio dicarboxylicus TaxID=83767 RepID=A0A1G8AJY5_9RHOO|nr:type IV pili methyl-accepting chemotaxis transducer N-terminal domain-containing protein [Propionivibrio dicarboxylicus]SDH21153.1 signal transduction histidine kinase, nitrate/nitrite-specific, NarQ [Propionivibrio dicarboxylicus]